MPRLLLCYRAFEQIVEANLASCHACLLMLTPQPDILLRMELDCPELRFGEEGTLREALKAQGLRLDAAREDDTWRLTLRAESGKRREAEA